MKLSGQYKVSIVLDIYYTCPVHKVTQTNGPTASTKCPFTRPITDVFFFVRVEIAETFSGCLNGCWTSEIKYMLQLIMGDPSEIHGFSIVV